MNPRNLRNLCLMICFHARLSLGDNHQYNPSDYEGWAGLKAALIRDHKPAVILPLYLYNHGALAISTESFVGRAVHAEWDSGRVGFILAPAAAVRKHYKVQRISKKLQAQIEKDLLAEVEAYNSYLQGE